MPLRVTKAFHEGTVRVPVKKRAFGDSSSSVAHFFGFKLQVQKRLTRQIAENVSSLVDGDVMSEGKKMIL
ncbi:hypothetical protein SAY87_005929 [Trapa incisa]|uniref:Uncharacterized protein n=1 Tax=Trapa incisa TaxID=236973 RepID=A0AAN7K6P4_9MYRT|nr:hypothetical protein SAY87_005929 [Trapa incisa]